VFLAFKEIRRNIVRFVSLAFAVGLLLFLVLFQQALRSGLLASFVGGIRNQTAPVIVYSVEAQRTLQGGLITPDLEAQIARTDGLGASARLGQGTFTVRVGDGEFTDAAIIGIDNAQVSRPATLVDGRLPASAGEAVGNAADFHLNDVVRVVQAHGDETVTISVVGLADNVQLNVTPTLFTDFDTYAAAVWAVNPDAAEVLPNAILLEPKPGVSDQQLADAANATSPDVDAVTRRVAADTAPGVKQVSQSFLLIFALYALVVPLVTGLFFLIWTLQKARSLVLLRAIGASASVLVRAVLIQVVLVTSFGILIGTALYSMIARGRVGGLSLDYDGGAVRLWTVAFLGLAVVGSLVSIRRVLRIDPIEATTGGGQR